MTGETLGHFRILHRLGAGGMGEVFVAEDTRLGRRVALKVIAPALVADPFARERFLQEARAASALDHPNICAIHGIELAADGRMAIVMAYYEGETLEQRQQAGGVPMAEALGVAAQVADGLARAHEAGIVHRDIKPANVILTADGLAKILDFGVARVQDSALTATGAAVGTPAYMAPEQIRGETVDARADLWALGVTLYTLLAHRHPFAGESSHQIVYAALEREPTPLAEAAPDVPAAVAALVARCLAKPREQRIGSAKELAHGLREALRALSPAQAGALPPLARAALELGSRVSRPLPAPASDSALTSARTTPLGTPSAAPPAARRGRALALGLGLGALALAVAGVLLWPRLAPASRPLRVAVLPALVEGAADSAAARVSVAATEAALLRGLLPLRGLTVVDPAELRGLPSDPVAAARALGADEMIEARLVASSDEWFVTLRRLSGRDAKLLGVRSLNVPASPALEFANALGIEMMNTYPGRAASRALPALQVTRPDYDEYVLLYQLERDRESGGMTPEQLLARMRTLAERTPRFADAQVLLQLSAYRRFLTTRDTSLLVVAEGALRRAQAASPDDPRVQFGWVDVALARSDLDGARRHLQALELRLPGNADVLQRRAVIDERAGDAGAALAALGEAARRRPSRALLRSLADLEMRQGRIAAARAHLDTLLARFPSDRYPLSKLAQLELMNGEPARADSLYGRLVEAQPGQVPPLANRGLARMLRADYAGAEADFAAVLAIAPDNLDLSLNRADCLGLMGRTAEARQLYARIERDSRAASDADDPFTRLRRAQCLARLERAPEAAQLATAALADAGEDGEAHYAAALVAALAAQPDSALARARRALALGVGPSWFALPWFDAVRAAPAFRAALAAAKQ